MRPVSLIACGATALACACSDPQCPEGRVKVGMVCVPTDDTRDSSAAGQEDNSSTAEDAGAGGRPFTSRLDASPRDRGVEYEGGAAVRPAQHCGVSSSHPECEAAELRTCNADGTAEQKQTCVSERHCQLGVRLGRCASCLPGEFHCADARLEVCADDGRGFVTDIACDSSALCNPLAGACTSAVCDPGNKTCAGDMLRVCNENQSDFKDEQLCGPGLCDPLEKECDKCIPNARSCTGNSVEICDAQGHNTSTESCRAPRAKCAAGTCVECTEASDCRVVSECEESLCEGGVCGSRPKSAHVPCASGAVCNGSGQCIGCIDSSDCEGAAKFCIGGRCVACRNDSDCNTAAHQACQNSVCVDVPYCGDGTISSGEECEPGVDGWVSQTCDAEACERNVYEVCETDSDCPFTDQCVNKVCATDCTGSTSADPLGICKILPGYTKSCVLDKCFVQCASGSCPSGLTCQPPGSNYFLKGMCLGELVPL